MVLVYAYDYDSMHHAPTAVMRKRDIMFLYK